MKHLVKYNIFENRKPIDTTEAKLVYDEILQLPEYEDFKACLPEKKAISDSSLLALGPNGRIDIVSGYTSGFRIYLSSNTKHFNQWVLEQWYRNEAIYTRSFETLKMCIRHLWIITLSRNIKTPGISRIQYENWLSDENNIKPGLELHPQEIEKIYAETSNEVIHVPKDLDTLFGFKNFELFKKMFNVSRIEWTGSKEIHFDWEPKKLFGIGKDDSITNTYGISFMRTNKSESIGMNIFYKDADSFRKHLIKLLYKSYKKKWERIKEQSGKDFYGKDEREYWGKYEWTFNIGCLLFSYMEGNNSRMTLASEKFNEKLRELKNSNPIEFAEALSGLKKSGLFPEVLAKFSDEKSTGILSGGNLLKRLGADQ